MKLRLSLFLLILTLLSAVEGRAQPASLYKNLDIYKCLLSAPRSPYGLGPINVEGNILMADVHTSRANTGTMLGLIPTFESKDFDIKAVIYAYELSSGSIQLLLTLRLENVTIEAKTMDLGPGEKIILERDVSGIPVRISCNRRETM